MGREASDLLVRKSDDRLEQRNVEAHALSGIERGPSGAEEHRVRPGDFHQLREASVGRQVEDLQTDVPPAEGLDERFAWRRRDGNSTAALHPHPCRDHAVAILDYREAAALASEGEPAGSGPDLPEHERAILAHFDVDFDIGVGQIHAHPWMGETHDIAEVAGQVLARERMGTYAPGPKRERLPGREGPLRLGEDDVPQRCEVGMRLRGGADRDDAEHPREDRARSGHVVRVDIDARLVGVRYALDAFGREEILNVRDEPVAELAAYEPALQRNFPKSHEQDQSGRTVQVPIFLVSN